VSFLLSSLSLRLMHLWVLRGYLPSILKLQVKAPRDGTTELTRYSTRIGPEAHPWDILFRYPLPIWLVRKDSPSNKTTSAPPSPIAIARAILCPSPPLNVLHSLAHIVRSIPHSSAIRYGSSPPFPLLFCVLRDWKDLIRFRKSIGVPGRREGR
jgi:hypothetical protein